MFGRTIDNVTLIGLVCSALILLSCTSPQVPAPPVQEPAQGAVQPQGWEQDWQRTLAAAKQEGPILIYASSGSEIRQGISKGFKEKFGLDIEWLEGKSADIPPRIIQERRAGLYIPDLVMGSTTRQLTVLKPGGMLDPIKPLLVLPEVLDEKLWFRGNIPWVDNEKMYTMNSLLGPAVMLAVNNTMVRPDEIKSYNDLLDPRWKGKIVFQNPVLATGPFTQITHVMGTDWWVKLVQNDPVLVSDDRLGVEWVARGRYPIRIVGRTDILMEFIRAGAPLTIVWPKEGAFLSGGAIATSLLNRAPHPNAAKVYVNWYLSKDGSTVQSRVVGVHSARTDVPTDHLRPEDIRDPSVKYVETEAEWYFTENATNQAVAAKIFAPLLK